MEAQSESQHARPEAHMVINPVGGTGVMVLTRDMGANPNSNIRRNIEVASKRIWLVLIDRRSPVNRDAAENEAEKDRHIQPVTPAHQKMMPPGHLHARLFRQRARGDRFSYVELLHGSSPGGLMLVVAGRGDELKDLVRSQRSVRQLLGRRIDDIAGAQSYLFFCNQRNGNTGRY